MTVSRIVTCLVLLSAAAHGASSQSFDPNADMGMPGVRKWYKAEDVIMRVRVWGGQAAGFWEMPVGTPLIDMLTVVGGPISGMYLQGTKTEIRIRVERVVDERSRVVFEHKMEDFSSIPNSDFILEDGDFVFVETFTKRKKNFQTYLLPFTTAMSTVVLGYTFYRLLNGDFSSRVRL